MTAIMSTRARVAGAFLAALVLGPGAVPAWGQGMMSLDTGTYHIGNGQFSDSTDQDIVAQNAVVGPKWSIAFSADRPILCWIQMSMLYGVGGSMPDYAECGTVSIDGVRLGTIRPPNNRRPWVSETQCSLSSSRAYRTVTIESHKWQGDYDDFVFRDVILLWTPANARVSVVGAGQILQEGEDYGETRYVSPYEGIRLDALRDGGALQWGPNWKVYHSNHQMFFMRNDGRAGVIIPLGFDIDPLVQRPSGACMLADSNAGHWRQVDTPWLWSTLQRQQPTDYVNPTSCWIGRGWNVSFVEEGQGKWIKLTQQIGIHQRILYLGSDGHIHYFDRSNSGGFIFTQ